MSSSLSKNYLTASEFDVYDVQQHCYKHTISIAEHSKSLSTLTFDVNTASFTRSFASRMQQMSPLTGTTSIGLEYEYIDHSLRMLFQLMLTVPITYLIIVNVWAHICRVGFGKVPVPR